VLGAVKAPTSSILADLIFTTETKRIKLIGDSITHGMGSSDFKQSTDASDFLFNAGTFPQYRNYGVKCWAGMLKSYLEEKFNCSVVNNGASGASSKQLVDNWDAIVSADDDVIICMIGTNDRNGSLLTTYQNLVAIYEKAQAKGQRVIFVSAPPASNEIEEQATAFHLEDLDNLYNYAYNTLRVGYISVYKAFLNYCRDTGTKIDDLLSDGLHPNDEGYQIMYEIVLEALGFGRKRDQAIKTRDEITYSKAGDIIGEGVRTSKNAGKITKSNDGVAVCGYTLNSDNKAGTYYVVAETQDGCAATNIEYVGTVDYNGKAYHYAKNSVLANINYNNASTLSCWFIGASATYADEAAVARLLDYYFCKIDS
jgi:lysophospholipase L1-like esterase